MIYTGFELAYLFFFYSFMGWCLEVVYAAAAQKTFVTEDF